MKFESKDNILIKPSVVTAAYAYQSVNTNPEFLDGLLKVLFDFGIKKEHTIIAEQALIGSDSKDAAAKAGILDVCKKNGIEFHDISKGPFEEIESEGYKFKVFKEAMKRKIINVPVMKTNFQLGISGAMENLARLADEHTQRDMYFDDIDKTLPKLAKALGVFTIADATNGMQGQGPLLLGEPAFFNLVLASNSIENVDKCFCEAFMLQEPGYLKAIGIDIKNIEVVGNSIDSLKYSIKPSSPNETAHPDIKVIDGKACPACLNRVDRITSRLIGLRGDELTIVMGAHIDPNKLKGKERLVILGNCAIKSLNKLGLNVDAKLDEKTDELEQLVLMKKLLT
ncbi:MAG: DUF362 domain-containing protein, partial [Nanoarchaeota archaeon]